MQWNSKIKKILVSICFLLCLTACKKSNPEISNPSDNYRYIIEMIKDNDNFVQQSSYYDIDVQIAKIDDGYRYYIIIDNPKIAMYDIVVVGIEKGVDYTNTMAANVGIFEESKYNIVPNQANPDKGYVKGLVVSGICENPKTDIYVYVQFSNKDYSSIHGEYLKLSAEYEEQ